MTWKHTTKYTLFDKTEEGIFHMHNQQQKQSLNELMKSFFNFANSGQMTAEDIEAFEERVPTIEFFLITNAKNLVIHSSLEYPLIHQSL